MSGLAAVDVVVREREAIAALPSVVRVIRRFAKAPLFRRLKHAMLESPVTIATIESLLAQHSEDLCLEVLESGIIKTQPLKSSERGCLPADQAKLMNDVLHYGAQHGSLQIVEWALRASSTAKAVDALRTAIYHGQLVIVQFLYPRMDKWCNHSAYKDEPLLTSAASYGHVEVLQWVYTNRRNPSVTFDHSAWILATRRGYLEVLKWMYANSTNHFFTFAFREAALTGQRDILDWIYEVQPPPDASYTMMEVAKRRDFETLVRLHEKDSTQKISSWALGDLSCFGIQPDVVRWLLRHFPDRYTDEGVVTGTYCDDLEIAQRLAAKRFPTRKNVKRAMFVTAKYGYLNILQWLSHLFGKYDVPVRVLWCALFRGHLSIVRWVMEQTPQLLTRERLAEMRTASLRQAASNVDPNGDIQEVTRWIEEQQHKLNEQ